MELQTRTGGRRIRAGDLKKAKFEAKVINNFKHRALASDIELEGSLKACHELYAKSLVFWRPLWLIEVM